MALKLIKTNLNVLMRTKALFCFTINSKQFYCNKTVKIPTNVLKNAISADAQTECGVIYDKKPFKLVLQAGKRYSWCLCGRSHTQPFCDATHRNQQLKIKQKPITFAVDETKEYWLCNCKQTRNRPFCDGSHKSQFVLDGTSIIRQ